MLLIWGRGKCYQSISLPEKPVESIFLCHSGSLFRISGQFKVVFLNFNSRHLHFSQFPFHGKCISSYSFQDMEMRFLHETQMFVLKFVFSTWIRKLNFSVQNGLILSHKVFSNCFHHNRFKNVCAFKNAIKNIWVGRKIRTS